MPDTSVKFLHSGMLGAPRIGVYGTIIQAQQGLFDVFSSALVTGFNTQTATSISVADGVATATFGATHGFERDAVVLVSGASVAGLNGEKRVLSAPSVSQITFDAAGLSDQQVLTGATVKYAPLGWEVFGSPTTLPATFRSADPTGTGFTFTLTSGESNNSARVSAYRSAIGSTPTQQFAAQKYLYMGRGFSSSVSYGGWAVFGDGKTVYLLLHAPVTSDQNFTSAFNGLLHVFGDFEPLTSTDAYRSLLHTPQTVMSADTAEVSNVTYLQNASISAATWLAGSVGGGGVTEVRSGLETLYDGVARVAGATGSTATPTYPNAPDVSLILSRRFISDNTGVRGFFRGMYQSPQPCATAFAPFDRVEGQGPLAGRRLVAVRCGQGASNSTTGTGVTFFDVTGPWA